MTQSIETWLLQSAVLFLMTGSVAGLVVGVTLMFNPDRLRALSTILNRWISTRHLDRSLERSVNVDSWFYRHSRINGALALLGASYILYFFAAGMDRSATINGLSTHLKVSTYLVAGLLDAFVLIVLLGALCAVFVSLFLLFRPSLLREIELKANQWKSIRRALKPMEITHEGVDDYIFQNGRRVGILLALGSLYTLVLLTFWFIRYY